MSHERPKSDRIATHLDAAEKQLEQLDSSTGNRWRPALLRPYLPSLAVIAICGVVGWFSKMMGLADANIVMIFLAGVAYVAARSGHGPAVAAAILGVLVFDFFFVDPVFAFAPSDTQYFFTLAVMLGIGLLISELMAKVRAQLQASQEQERRTAELLRLSQEQERRTAQLYQMTRQLSVVAGTEFLVQISGRQLREAFLGEVALYLREPDGSLQQRFGESASAVVYSGDRAAVQWVAYNNHPAGFGTEAFPEATSLFVPMIGAHRTLGVVGLRPNDAGRLLDSEERRMLETCAHLIALSIERDQSLMKVQQAQIQVQSEQLRNALLSAVSHDLRTPLAMIAVTASSLLEGTAQQSWPVKLEMLQTIEDESRRLSRQVDNLLDMARLDSGAIVLNREWQVLEELVGVALTRLRREIQGRVIHVQIPDDFPLLWVAADLIEQMLINLLENAVRYTPEGSSIELTAEHRAEHALIRVADRGPGLPPGSETKVFDKFFRGHTKVADGQRGIGLGLAICQAIVRAHDGQITAANRPAGGAEFVVSLPCPRASRQDTLHESTASTVS